ncbi:lipopolysaccharide-induced tumor necrosis factor-alpha factor-like [Tropilaelaps mercedesae]|uniref:Lipopolysaccharide-induced tumor necrosis factor-alpha factor-like n=1 Tax=Tropilaelaps mercedesae TaxID=418985 RepID=A0A1V9XCS5_9ACAR|nr:lipopolysaccharide-induced tumor necrosis factor-alpha factor-like [Tropilaelaps mercedesae]
MNHRPHIMEVQPMLIPPIGPHMVKLTCPHCTTAIVTKTTTERGMFTYVSSLVIGSLGGAMCCLCLVPCFLHDFHDVLHHCPHCDNYIGKYKRG